MSSVQELKKRRAELAAKYTAITLKIPCVELLGSHFEEMWADRDDLEEYIKSRSEQESDVTGETMAFTVFIVPSTECATLPMVVNRQKKIPKTWRFDPFVLGIPDYIPIPGRVAYVLHDVVMLLERDPVKGADAEVGHLDMDYRTEYLEIRCRGLQNLIETMERAKASRKRIAMMRVSLKTLQSYLQD